ncbi:MAG: hypothetical protein E7213_00210 [Clostridium sp.]|nr:hypothetical protein [Clostridium sp.]
MKIYKHNVNYKNKIRILYLLALSVIFSLILASNISMIYFASTTVNRMVISSILLTISGVIISIPVYITTNMLKTCKTETLKAFNILLNISGTALFMMLIYILFTIYHIVCI